MATVARMQRNNSDLLVAEMLYSFWKSILKMRKGAIDHHPEPNVTGYMARTLVGDLKRAIASDGLMRLTADTYKKHKGEIRKVLFYTDDLAGRNYDIKELESEVFNRACQTDREREIIRLRVEGFKDEEIGKRLDLTKARVHQLRGEIAKRLAMRLES